MRYCEFAIPREQTGNSTMRELMDRVRAISSAHIFPEVGVETATQRADRPHEVDCPGLTVHDLGQDFAEEFQGRRLWCRQHCRDEFSVEPIREGGGEDTGRRFRFADQADAALFLQHWG